MTNLVNAPLPDMRTAMFAADLKEYIKERGEGLPIPSIVSAMETIKFEILVEMILTNRGL